MGSRPPRSRARSTNSYLQRIVVIDSKAPNSRGAEATTKVSRWRRTAAAGLLVAVLTPSACSGGTDAGNAGTESCESLLAAVDDAELEKGLAPGLAKNADSDGGRIVTDTEAEELQGYEDALRAARDAATAKGCL